MYKPLTAEQKTLMTKMATQGFTVREIGAATGVSFGKVAKIIREQPNDFDDKLLKLLMGTKKRWNVLDLTDHFSVGATAVRDAVRRLKAGHHNLIVDDLSVEATHLIPRNDPRVIDVSKFKGKEYRFGVTGDNHLGSKYERMDVLNALFDIWVEQGVTDVYQCGNMIEGEARFNRQDLLAHGMQNQADYFAENWPQRKGIVTHFVTGDDHEGWYVQREGVNIGQFLQDSVRRAGREDLKYLGHMEHDIAFTGTDTASIMRVIHAGGGTAYAISYKTQKIVESYQGGEKPNILLVGHYHKFDHSYPREVSAIQVGCTKDQDSFMRKNNIQGMIGGVTLKFTMDPYGFAHGIDCQWHPFYDRSFYNKWNYKF